MHGLSYPTSEAQLLSQFAGMQFENLPHQHQCLSAEVHGEPRGSPKSVSAASSPMDFDFAVSNSHHSEEDHAWAY